MTKSLPDWTFNLNEVSAGSYVVVGKHKLGARVEISGADPNELLLKAKTAAAEMEASIYKKLSAGC